MSFEVDFVGRLNKVRVSAASGLQAVFEAVANAFDSTASHAKDGVITVRILQKQVNEFLTEDDEPRFEVSGFEIIDNGVGFTDENLASFKKSDSRHKSTGKGVGRLLWLHVFSEAQIDSVYRHGDALMRRRFTFSKANHGVVDSETQPVPQGYRTMRTP